ncbi:MAG TPA: hypothetical protein VGI24_01060 [Solirubrobacteraceae bacterium]|jgi:hypothetical protein
MQSDIRGERLVVLQVLNGESTRAGLVRELDLDDEAITRALKGLEAAAVVVIDGHRVRPSKCMQRLDVLDLISV